MAVRGVQLPQRWSQSPPLLQEKQGKEKKRAFSSPHNNLRCFATPILFLLFSGSGTAHSRIILRSLDTFLIFPNFLRSEVLSRSATRLYHVYK